VKRKPKKSQLEIVNPESFETEGEMNMDPQEYESFIEQAVTDYESSLIGYARTYVYDLDRARDVVQDTFIRLCKQDPEKVRGNLKSWLFTVCRNRCLDVLRKDKRIEPMDDAGWQKLAGSKASPDEQADHDDGYMDVMRYMDRLSVNQKEVILLKFQQGMSYEEIHRVTGLTSGNIGFLIHAGLKRLRGWILEKGEAHEH
jgi:RNA polymerase sigma factor (sigma-70 family)